MGNLHYLLSGKVKTSINIHRKFISLASVALIVENGPFYVKRLHKASYRVSHSEVYKVNQL